jgi:hypothetical protein
VSKIFFTNREDAKEEKRKSSQLIGRLLWQYDFIYEQDFFYRRGRRGHGEREI